MTDRLRADEAGLAEAARLLARGQLVAFPTDTVYGVGVAAARPDRIDELFALKRRPTDRRIPLLVANLDQAIAAGARPDVRATAVAARWWPGALTLVLPTADGTTQAYRAPDHPVALALVAAAGPIFTTSANISDEPDTLGADEVLVAFATNAERLAAVVDGGAVPGGRASTVLDLSDSSARILREGPISREALADVVDLA